MGDEGTLLAPPRFASDAPAVTILHVSDVQFGRYHRFADEGGGSGRCCSGYAMTSIC